MDLKQWLVRAVLQPLFGLLFSRAVLEVAHAYDWYPEKQLAELLLGTPSLLQISWVRYGLLALVTLVLWAIADYFVYRRSGAKAASSKLAIEKDAPTSLEVAVRIDNDCYFHEGYEVACSIVITNTGVIDRDGCLVQIDDYIGHKPLEMRIPFVLRTDGQLDGKREGRFQLSAGQPKRIPIIFRRSNRANDWFFFSEKGKRLGAFANPTILLVGVYGIGAPVRVRLFIDVDAGWAVHARIESSQSKGPSDSKRVGLLEVFNTAEKNHHWDFTGQNSLDILDFTYGLRQAGRDGSISFFGKENRNSFESLTRNEVLVPIAESHWGDYELDFFKARDANDNFFVWSLNKRGNNIRQGGYADIQASKSEIMTWLESEAESFKGHTKRWSG